MQDAGDHGPRGLKARNALREAAPRLNADQAETALSRLRDANYGGDDETVTALLQRLKEAGGKRRGDAARKWFNAELSAREERRAERQRIGTVAEQRTAYRSYIEHTRRALEAGTRGQMLNPRARESGVWNTEALLTSNPATIRKHASEEALRWFAENGNPLSFDAWRYENLGARDARAVASWQRRNGGFFSEHG